MNYNNHSYRLFRNIKLQGGGGGSSLTITTTIAPLQQNIIWHTPGTGGLNYLARRTNLTGDISNRSIKENTPIPTSFKDIDFLNNYAEFKKAFRTVPDDYSPTFVPMEGDKHWNIKRFVIQPHLTTEMGDLNVQGSTADQLKANVLSDMYEYYLLQNQGNRNKSFRQAKRFLRRNVNPILNGPFLNEFINVKDGTEPNFGLMDPVNTFADQNPIKTLESYNKAFRESEGMKLYNPNYNPDLWNREKLQNITMDYLKNYRNMSNRQAKKLWRKWEDETKDEVNVRVGSPKSGLYYDMSSEEAFYNSPIFQNPTIFAKPRTNEKVLSGANRMVEWTGEDRLPHRRLFPNMAEADYFMKYLTDEKKSFGTSISNRGILNEDDRREFQFGGYYQKGGFFRDLFEGVGDFFRGIFSGKGGRGSFACPGDVCSPGKIRFEKTGRSRFRDAISNLFGGKGSDGETPKIPRTRRPIENGSFTGINDEEPEQPEEWQGRCFDDEGNVLPYYYDDSGRLIPCTNQITITNYYNTYTNPYNQPAAQPTPQEQSGSPVYDDAIVQSPEARGAGSFDMQGNFTASQGNLARYGGIRTPNKRKKFRSY